MGVRSFWDIVGPTAKPVRLESLEEKRMAVDASIWVYQFLKAVRDNEGNSVNNAHVVGFFRRICKLLYYGIKPVFVFDGGVPILKRNTIQERKERRQGQRDNVALTARKLLAIQFQKKLQDDLSKDKNSSSLSGESNVKPSNVADSSSKYYKPHDEWDLPEISGFKVSKNDNRMATAEKFDEMLNSLEDEWEGIDLESINPASKEFEELPVATQYMILTTLRLKSRLRLGYSKEQLENIFPNSMEFSKFQIDMVKRRNFFTQKLLGTTNSHDGGALNGNESDIKNRIAGQFDKEYTLSKTEQGWALGFANNDGFRADKPIEIITEEDIYYDNKKHLKKEHDSNEHLNKTIDLSRNEKKMHRKDITDIEDEDEDEEFDWEDVDTTKKEEKEIEDYSLKAAKLSQFYKPRNDAGSQAFLDSRREINTSPAKKGTNSNLPQLYHIKSDNDIEELDSDDSENEFKHQLREIELMENMRKVTSYNAHSKEVIQDEERTNFDPIKSSSILKESSIIENKIVSDIIDDKIEAAEKVKPYSEAQQQLDYIVNQIPGFDNMNSSILFNNQEFDKKGEENKDFGEILVKTSKDKIIKETPLWFQDNTQQKFDSYSETVEKVNKIKDNISEITNKGDQHVHVTGPSAEQLLTEYSKNLNSNRPIHGSSLTNDLEIISEIKTRKSPRIQGNDTNFQKRKDQSVESNAVQELDDNELIDNIHSSSDNILAEEKTPAIFEYDFSEDEENEIVDNIIKEGKEFNSFKMNLNDNHAKETFMEDEIFEQNMKNKRDSDEVTPEMIKSVQELLTRFGIPYIIAPMEAEAQCAELLQKKLVDGIITDDSDVFLFGGSKIYKNMFQEKNYVEFYDLHVIEQQLGLGRDNMIDLALLLGSDYTTGIKGIGPVSGIEILAEFKTLEKFRDWYTAGQFGRKIQENEEKFEKDLRKKLVKNEVVLDESFPSSAVRDAYIHPEVDKDETKFTWGIPDLDMLRTFMLKEVRWSQEKSDEILIPLIRDINKRKRKPKQQKLTDFFPTELISTSKTLNVGKRVLAATTKLKKRRLK